MRDKKDWTIPLTEDDDLCAECGDTSACPTAQHIQSIEVEGCSVCITCPDYTISTEHTVS